MTDRRFSVVAWILVGVTCVVGLVVTLVALVVDRVHSFVPPEQSWVIPTPVEVRATRFPVVWRGYHPASVDVFVEALATAYEELYDLAGPDLVSQARQRVDRRPSHAHELPKEVR